MSLMPDESTDLYAQAFGSFLLNTNQLACNHPDHHSKAEMDELQEKVDQLVSEATVRVGEMEKLVNEVGQSQVNPFIIFLKYYLTNLLNFTYFRRNCKSFSNESSVLKMTLLKWRTIESKKTYKFQI